MTDDMVLIPAGEFRMGSTAYYPEETPVHTARVSEFLIDRHLVTNAQFCAFVDATNYVTVAERPLSAADFPQLGETDLAAGSLAFNPTSGPVDLRDWRAWWTWVPGANWRHPFGPGSTIDGKDHHPVVQVCFSDAAAYAAWAGRRLPSELEWERAARGGLDRAEFAWGDELKPGGRLLANTWQGRFPYENKGAEGHVGTSPVGSFPPSGYGLLDMIGNVWEWTSSRFTPDHRAAALEAQLGIRTGDTLRLAPGGAGPGSTTARSTCGCGCGGGGAGQRRSAGEAGAGLAPDPAVQRVTKGGSHLCAPEYCRRYRPAARSPQSEDSATTHIGFRCAANV